MDTVDSICVLASIFRHHVYRLHNRCILKLVCIVSRQSSLHETHNGGCHSFNYLPARLFLHAFLSFFQNQLFSKNSIRNTIRVSNSLDPV